MRQGASRLVLLLLAFTALPMQAEGPLYVGGSPQSVSFPNGIPNSVPGKPFHWNPSNFPLTYWTDPTAGVGSMTKTQSDDLVKQAFSVWQSVPTTTITFNKAGDLGGNVTASNAQAVINAVSDCSTLSGGPLTGGVARDRTIIYDDSQGHIITALGDDPNSTLGFADAVCLSSDGTDNYFNRGYAVLGGLGITSTNASTKLLPVMVHEFGHMIGLDHSQINLDCLNFADASTCPGIGGVPTMFPILMTGGEDQMISPAADDIAGISALYPGATFASSTGTITGYIYFSDTVTQAQGLNVIARLVSDPLNTAVSNVSGDLHTGDNGNPFVQSATPGLTTPSPFGSHNDNQLGLFTIPGLPPGNYTVEVEAINNSGLNPFVGGSGLQPIGGLGFEYAMPGICSTELWNSSESNNDLCTASTPIPVTAGPTPASANIILNGTGPRYDAWEDGP